MLLQPESYRYGFIQLTAYISPESEEMASDTVGHDADGGIGEEGVFSLIDVIEGN